VNEEHVIAQLLDAVRASGAATGGQGEGQPLGPGDDAALLTPPLGQIVWSVDDHLEGIHFDRAWCSLDAVGRRAIGSALSDLAACGAEPLGALLALSLPAGTKPHEIDALGAGLGAGLAACGCPLLGGNVTRSQAGLSLSVSVLGSPSGPALLRGTARAGDELYVSGRLGEARLAFEWLNGGGDPRDSRVAVCVARYLAPSPRFDVARQLREAGLVPACMDLSDGLARDLPRLLRASGLAARVDGEALPGPDPTAASAVDASAAELAWLGGEDYELLLAGPPELAELPTLHRIGELVAGPPGEVQLTGLSDAGGGFDHFG
jgi:thiamine-monophosphate kinase